MLRQTVVLQRRTAKLFNDASKALHKRIHIFRLCLIHPHCVRCDFMAPIRAFTPCRAKVPCAHKSFKTVSQLLENPYLYFCLANAGSPSQFACYPKAVRTGAPPKIKHRTPPPCVRPGSPPGLKFSLRPARPNGPFPFSGRTEASLGKTTLAACVHYDGAHMSAPIVRRCRSWDDTDCGTAPIVRQSQSCDGTDAENRAPHSVRSHVESALRCKDAPACRRK